jgi:hypothetical protein
MTATPTGTPTPLPPPPSIESTAKIPYWATRELELYGMTIIALGAVAMLFNSRNSRYRSWGFRVVFLGCVMVILGVGAHWINNLLKYVIQI